MFAFRTISVRAALVCAALPFFVAGCASGPTYAELHATEPPVAADSARIYFYRLGDLGAIAMGGTAIQPAVKLDGIKVGDVVPGGYFYVDRPAGTYEISVATEKEEDINITVKPGETRYVRFDPGMGIAVVHFLPTLIWPDQGAEEIKELHYTGAKSS